MTTRRKAHQPKSHALRAMNAVAAAKLPCSTKAVLYALCRRLNTERGDWCVWGGVRRIAREAGLAVSSAQRVRSCIVEMGIATVMGRHDLQRDGWRGRPSTCLRINVGALERLAAGPAQSSDGRFFGVPATDTNHMPATDTNHVPATGTEMSKASPKTQGSSQEAQRRGAAAPAGPSAGPEGAARAWTDEQLAAFTLRMDDLGARFEALGAGLSGEAARAVEGTPAFRALEAEVAELFLTPRAAAMGGEYERRRWAARHPGGWVPRSPEEVAALAAALAEIPGPLLAALVTPPATPPVASYDYDDDPHMAPRASPALLSTLPPTLPGQRAARAAGGAARTRIDRVERQEATET